MVTTILKLLKGLPIWAWVLAAILVFGGGRLLWLERNLNQAEAQIVTVGLQKDSIEAAADSLRDITDDLAARLGIEISDKSILEKRVLQVEQERDSIDVALRRSSVLNGQLEASVARLEAILNAPVTEDEDNVRYAVFHRYIEPYTVDLNVGLPPPPAEGIADISVEVDPIEAEIRVQCGQKDELTGIRPASVLWGGPTWLTLSDLSVSQDPDVCNDEVIDEAEEQKSTLQTVWTWTQRIGLFVGGVWAGSR